MAVLYLRTSGTVQLQGRPLWPSGRSQDRIFVTLACFEGFPLCQRQDPTEEDLPDKRLKPLVLTQRVLLVLVLIYDCLFNSLKLRLALILVLNYFVQGA